MSVLNSPTAQDPSAFHTTHLDPAPQDDTIRNDKSSKNNTKEGTNMQFLSTETPIGKLHIAAEGDSVVNIFFDGEQPEEFGCSIKCTPPESTVLEECAKQLDEYFSGMRKVFTVKIKPCGGKFSQVVYAKMTEELLWGKTISYGELAMISGSPKGARAVGMAQSKNPIPIIIPCHRVVGKNGNLTGFRWGLDVKKKLLVVEHLSIFN